MKIALTSIFVNNPIEAHKFYTEKLGFTSRMFMPEAFLAIVASPEQPDGAGLLLEPNMNLGAKEFQENIYKAGLPIIVFGVDDINKEYERLKNLGVIFKNPPTKRDWGTEAVFDDTCGNYVQIMQNN
ncbi:VOC family protein [Chryseosolibacter indicus]|uniref:VOC family protein n=1 Tax=Chryseosolibacter indicus TaxID=2782351 RepID=A0ABS5VQG1_9BACT|nr:VOC family protein [Chryseosolibacter indicus]MBT1703689.1 VOC family protein [Chryseosolibacter indicus]